MSEFMDSLVRLYLFLAIKTIISIFILETIWRYSGIYFIKDKSYPQRCPLHVL